MRTAHVHRHRGCPSTPHQACVATRAGCWQWNARKTSRSRSSLQTLGSLADALDAALSATVIRDAPMRVLNISSSAAVDLLRERGALDVLSVVPDEAEAAVASTSASTLGNEAAARSWVGDVVSVPPYMGPFSVAVVDRDWDGVGDGGLRGALVKASLMMRPGGHVLVYSSRGSLVDRDAVAAVVRDLCFEVVGDVGADGDAVLLCVPDGFAVPNASSPIKMAGEVVAGYGRGSRKLGVPTANLRPDDVASETDGLPLGVYFGFVRHESGSGNDGVVRKMVMNIGKRPTFVTDNGPEESIEVHVMDYDGGDFYGERLAVLVVGFLRPEMKFDGIDALLNRIQTDIGMARSQLDGDRWKCLPGDW